MADSNEILQQNTDALRAISDQLALNNELLSRTARKSGLNLDDLDKLNAGVKRATGGFTGLTEGQKAAQAAEDEATKAAANFRDSLNSAKQATLKLKDTILSTDQSFAKYNATLSTAGDAALSLGKTFGTFGAAIGGAIKGMTVAGEAWLTQTDNVLKASDSIQKFGGMGSTSTSELLKLGQGAGLTSKNLELLVKPLSGLGQSLISLGGTTGEGVKEFGKLTAITADQRKSYQRLGVSQEDLIQNQADYVKLQQLSGITITKSMKDSGALQRASLAYTDNLLELAAISGKSVEEIKKNNEAEAARYEILIKNNMQGQQALALEREGTKESLERAAQIRKEMDARATFLNDLKSSVGSEELSAGMSKFLSTGFVTPELSALKVQGLNLEKLAQDIKSGKDGKMLIDQFKKDLVQSVDKMALKTGTAAMLNKDTGKAVGLADQQLMQFAAANRENDPAALREKVRKENAAKKEPGADTAQDARATRLEAERLAAITLDKITAASNPLISGFNLGTLGVLALAGAAGAAATALTTMAGSAAMKGIGGMLPGTGGTVAGAPAGATAAAGAAKTIGARVLGLLGPAAAVIGAGAAGFAAGSLLNETFGISDKIVDALRSKADKELEARITAPTKIKPKTAAGAGPAPGAAPTVSAPTPTKSTTDPNEGNSPGRTSSDGGSKSMDDLKKMGLILKSGDVQADGANVNAKLLDLAKKTQTGIPGFKVFTGFNDDYHKKNSPGSRHAKGDAFDFALQQVPNRKEGAEIVAALKGMGADHAIDEYNNPSAKATGGHIHAQISAAAGGITSGPKSGYPATLHGTEVITPLEPNSILEKLAKTAADSSTITNSSVQIDQAMREMTQMHSNMMELFRDKLDEMISQLETSNDTQDALLKYSRT